MEYLAILALKFHQAFKFYNMVSFKCTNKDISSTWQTWIDSSQSNF